MEDGLSSFKPRWRERLEGKVAGNEVIHSMSDEEGFLHQTPSLCVRAPWLKETSELELTGSELLPLKVILPPLRRVEFRDGPQ